MIYFGIRYVFHSATSIIKSSKLFSAILWLGGAVQSPLDSLPRSPVPWISKAYRLLGSTTAPPVAPLSTPPASQMPLAHTFCTLPSFTNVESSLCSCFLASSPPSANVVHLLNDPVRQLWLITKWVCPTLQFHMASRYSCNCIPCLQ